MPCSSGYLAPTHREEELRRAAKLYAWLQRKLDIGVDPVAIRDSNAIYGGTDYVPRLCHLLSNMDADTIESIVYDAHCSTSRDLANWWEDHQKADRRRVDLEQERIRQQEETDARAERKRAVLARLSDEDRKVLELE